MEEAKIVKPMSDTKKTRLSSLQSAKKRADEIRQHGGDLAGTASPQGRAQCRFDRVQDQRRGGHTHILVTRAKAGVPCGVTGGSVFAGDASVRWHDGDQVRCQ